MPNFLFLFGSGAVIILTSIFGPMAILYSFFGKSMGFFNWCSRNWARGILGSTRTRVTVSGLENLPKAPAILIGNHQGAFDILALIGHLDPPPVFVAKHTLFKVPILGTAMLKVGHIPVDRTNKEKAIESINQGTKILKEKELNVVFFPEGTRTRDGKLLPFKKGAFMFALQSQLPVVPFVLTGSYETMPPGKNKVFSGDITLTFLPPMDTEKYSLETREQFMDDAKDFIAGALDKKMKLLSSGVVQP